VNLLATLWNGVRAVALRSPRGNAADGNPALFFALVLVYMVSSILKGSIETASPWQIYSYGISTILTDSMLTLAAAWVLVRIMQREGIFWGAASILLAATIVTQLAVHWPLGYVTGELVDRDHVIAALLVDIASRWWWLLVLIVFAHWLAPKSIGRALIAALLGYAVSAAAWWWLPAAPALTTEETTTADKIAATVANQDESGDDQDDNTTDASSEPDFDAEQAMYDQPSLLDAALAKIKPETPGKVDLYVVAFAGDADENVFRNEAEYVETLFTRRFDADGHVLVLENNAATVSTRPLATLTNLTWALDNIASKMNPAEDVLLVYLTTHGSHDHELLVDLDPLPLNQIGPNDLAEALKTKPGIRWKVLVVNACYSGGFIDALRDDSTMVLTSARSDRTSFGCGAQSDITYFGKAFLAEALNKTTSIREAFDLAKQSVSEWEDADKEEHSEPQIATTRSIEAKLDAWRQSLKPGDAVPFAPAE